MNKMIKQSYLNTISIKLGITTLSLFLSCFFFSNLLFAKSEHSKEQHSLDQVVAVVNDDVITKSELQHGMSIAKMQSAQTHVAPPSKEMLSKQVLNQLINKKLQLQMAKQAGIKVSDHDLEEVIQNVAKQNQMTMNALYQRLNQEGMSVSEYKAEMRNQLIVQKLQQQELISKINVTPEEVSSFMHSAMWQSNSSKEYQLQDILIPLPETPSTVEIINAKSRAENIIKQLRKKRSLREIAKSESNQKYSLEEENLGWRTIAEIPSAFGESVVSMQAGDVAGPIQTANGLHILRLMAARNRVGGEETAPNKKQVEALLMQRKFEVEVQQWLSKLRSQAFIEITPAKWQI